MQCHGCRFGCNVLRLQCGRGVMLRDARDVLQDGDGQCDHRLHIPASAQIARMIPHAALKVREEASRTDAQLVADILQDHGGFMTPRMISARTGMGADRLDAALEALQADGFVEIAEMPPCGTCASLTPAGRERAASWRAEHDAACEHLASPLSKDEQQQLVGLLFKLVGPR